MLWLMLFVISWVKMVVVMLCSVVLLRYFFMVLWNGVWMMNFLVFGLYVVVVLMVVMLELWLILVIVKVLGIDRFMILGSYLLWCFLVFSCRIVELKRFYCMFDLICRFGLVIMSFLNLVMLLLLFFLLLKCFGNVWWIVLLLMRRCSWFRICLWCLFLFSLFLC